MSFMGFIDYLMSWYYVDNYFELAFCIIFLTFVAFIIEMAICVNIAEIIKAILRKIVKSKKEKIVDDFFIEGINDLEDYDIFTSLKDQEA